MAPRRTLEASLSLKSRAEAILRAQYGPDSLQKVQKKQRTTPNTVPRRTKAGSKAQPVDLREDHTTSPVSTPVKKRKKTTLPSSPLIEKRLRRFRAHPPGTFLQKLERARTQRMIVLSRKRTSSTSEDIDIVGSTGNIYTVTIDNVPSCTCPDSLKGNECKHKVYALNTVLHAPENLVYQLALLTSELEEIFAGAPPIPADTVSDADADPNVKSKRKPIEADAECPICYMEMVADGGEELVWCKAACGNNMHKSCFDQWVASQRGSTVKCVYCRTPWEMDAKDLKKAATQGAINGEGYVNVAEQFGMSGRRDYSSYHPFWVRNQLGMGW
ncbi:uncharacterized protein AB675_809 [Cyphellophora attinorum]|uniref:E3 ubiquitin-protein ligase Zswim2 n=1 Tax=Cyphellophora attinorum TaxID=1664694 RepID=A0A0N1HHM3_9EURO|nr:uncharacterized protein AB675_809 [Phialophora attinorum]KPI46076.1 hypothetical protein AB675_809 [Phialophora attinorum]